MEKQINTPVEIIDFLPEYQPAMKALNIEWLEKYFEVEPIDEKVLSNPQQYIIDQGGKIFFAKIQEDIVGTVSLIKKSEHSYELSKMAVTDKVQSKGVGKILMKHCIDRSSRIWLVLLIICASRTLVQCFFLLFCRSLVT